MEAENNIESVLGNLFFLHLEAILFTGPLSESQGIISCWETKVMVLASVYKKDKTSRPNLTKCLIKDRKRGD